MPKSKYEESAINQSICGADIDGDNLHEAITIIGCKVRHDKK